MSKEKGIKFNSEMVNAILEGRKVQTRRVIAPQPFKGNSTYQGLNCKGNHLFYPNSDNESAYNNDLGLRDCPSGKVGDNLFVKETIFNDGDMFYYKASPGVEVDKLLDKKGWKPTISAQHMKQEQSRITLEITDIRVERLQDISEEDCKLEGIKYLEQCDDFKRRTQNFYWDYETKNFNCIDDPSSSFVSLWSSIYKNDPVKSWEANPFVWVIEFKPQHPITYNNMLLQK